MGCVKLLSISSLKHNSVFVAVAEFTFEVDAGFDGEGHAGFEGLVVFGV